MGSPPERRTSATGGGSFPYALPFARTYTSAQNSSDIGLGNGWANSFSIAATRTSDPYVGMGTGSPIGAPAAIAASSDMGENSAINAAAAIAAIYVSEDLLSGSSPKSAQYLTLAWLVSRWLTDQLTDNAVLVSWPGTSEEFTLLPHADGAASASYNPPLGSAVALTGSAPDPYGYFTTFTYRTKDQTQLAFNPVNSAGIGDIASWSFPYGMSVNFAYNYAYNGTSYLTNVSNTFGRSLTLAYSGAHVSTVTDDTGRSVAYGFDGNDNLVSFTDPLGYPTTLAYDGSAGHLTQIFYPSQPATAFVTNLYDGLGRVVQQANADGNATRFYFAGSRTELIDPAGDRHVTYQTPGGKILIDAWVLNSSFGDIFNDTAQQNGVVNVASSIYDGLGRLILATAPEGGTVAYTYSPDLEQNVITVTRTAKPGSPLSPLTTTYSYDPTYNKPTSITDPLGLITTMSYDPATGNLLSVVADAGGAPHFNATTRFTYTGQGEVLMATDPLGVLTQYAYDGLGNPISITRDAGPGHLNQVTRTGYNALGDVVSLTDPNDNTTASTYDADRRLVSTTSPRVPAAPNGWVTALGYDPDGRLLQTQRSASGTALNTTSASYTLTGQVGTTTDANGNVTRYAYDPVDRLSSVTDPEDRVTSYAYDAMSRRTAVVNAAIQSAPLVQRSYTPDGLVGGLTDANSHTTGFAYDGFDRLGTTTYPDASTEVRGYDADGNVLSRQTRAGPVIGLTYDTLNRLRTKATPSEPTVSYSYDLAGRLTGASDNSAAMAGVSGPSASYATSYSYDALNRPTNVTWTPTPTAVAPAASSVTFTNGYNRANQRISQATTDNSWWYYPPATPGTVNYTANALNQYTAVGAVTPTYDGNGNLTYDGTFTYSYDPENRVNSVKQGSSAVASYAYDAQGRRKLKTVGSTTTIYVTDADNREVLEYDGTSGQVQRWYAYGLGPNDVLNQMNVAAGTRETMIPDIQGSVLATLDSGSGALTKSGYRPYGESANSAGAFRYTGLRIDPETNGLYYARARMYSPALGRFLQVDPIGYAGGANLYAYVGNDPLNNVDSQGLWTLNVQINASLAGLVGIAGGIGFYVTSNNAFGAPDIGVFSQVGPAVGANIGIGASAGYTSGSIANFRGRVVSADVSAGSATASVTFGPTGTPGGTFSNPTGVQLGVALSPTVAGADISAPATNARGLVENLILPAFGLTPSATAAPAIAPSIAASVSSSGPGK